MNTYLFSQRLECMAEVGCNALAMEHVGGWVACAECWRVDVRLRSVLWASEGAVRVVARTDGFVSVTSATTIFPESCSASCSRLGRNGLACVCGCPSFLEVSSDQVSHSLLWPVLRLFVLSRLSTVTLVGCTFGVHVGALYGRFILGPTPTLECACVSWFQLVCV